MVKAVSCSRSRKETSGVVETIGLVSMQYGKAFENEIMGVSDNRRERRR